MFDLNYLSVKNNLLYARTLDTTRYSNANPNLVGNALSYNYYIKHLIIDFFNNPEWLLKKINATNISKLELHNSHKNNTLLKNILPKILKKNTQVKTLIVKHVDLELACKIFTSLARNKTLKNLALGNVRIDDEDRLTNALAKINNLNRLHLNILKGSSVYINNALFLTKIKSLSIHNNYLCDLYRFTGLIQNKELYIFDLMVKKWDKSDSFLLKNDAFRSLRLVIDDKDDDHLPYLTNDILSSLSANKKLVSLKIILMGINLPPNCCDGPLKQFSTFIKEHVYLNELSLSVNKLRPIESAFIFDSISNNNHIKIFEFQGEGSEDNIQGLTKMIEKNNILESLELELFVNSDKVFGTLFSSLNININLVNVSITSSENNELNCNKIHITSTETILALASLFANNNTIKKITVPMFNLVKKDDMSNLCFNISDVSMEQLDSDANEFELLDPHEQLLSTLVNTLVKNRSLTYVNFDQGMKLNKFIEDFIAKLAAIIEKNYHLEDIFIPGSNSEEIDLDESEEEIDLDGSDIEKIKNTLWRNQKQAEYKNNYQNFHLKNNKPTQKEALSKNNLLFKNG